MTSRRDQAPSVLLTVEAAADRMSTSVRFIRRLIAERRIEFVKVGRHVRISETALADFIEAGRVHPNTTPGVRPQMQGCAWCPQRHGHPPSRTSPDRLPPPL